VRHRDARDQKARRCGKRLRAVSSSRALRSKKASQDLGRFLPVSRLVLYLLPAGAGEAVVLGAPIVIRDSPLRSDVAFLFQLEQRWIKRSVVHRKQVAADLLDTPCNSIPM